MIVMLELFFWFLILEVEVEFWLIDDKKLKFFFKIINYSKCYDWVEDMLCIGLLKEFYQDREVSKKVGYLEWYKGNVQKFMEYNYKVDEDQYFFNRNVDLDLVRFIFIQSESGSIVNFENYEDVGVRLKIISFKKRRGRKKKNVVIFMENIIQYYQMIDEGLCEVQKFNFYDLFLYG